MNAIQLHEKTGKTVNSIKCRYRNKGFGSFSQTKELEPEFVELYNIEPNGERKTDRNKPDELKSAELKPEPTEPELIKQAEPLNEQVKPEQPELVQVVEKQDLGNALLTNPNAQFAYVLSLILVQAWLFASLCKRVFGSVQNELPFAALWVVGVLIGFSGLMLAKKTNANRDSERGSLWLFVFLVWQLLVCTSYFNLLGSQSKLIGSYVVAAAMPIAILAYSSLYLNEKI